MITPEKIAEASRTLVNADLIAKAAERVDIPFAVACALIEKESGGRNVYGRSDGGNAVLSGFPEEPNQANYAAFRWMVFTQGFTSNGVGPTQITSRGLLADMEAKGLKPWNPVDNMTYGFSLLKGYKERYGTWEAAGTRYNGSAAYGEDLAHRIGLWRARLRDT